MWRQRQSLSEGEGEASYPYCTIFSLVAQRADCVKSPELSSQPGSSESLSSRHRRYIHTYISYMHNKTTQLEKKKKHTYNIHCVLSCFVDHMVHAPYA